MFSPAPLSFECRNIYLYSFIPWLSCPANLKRKNRNSSGSEAVSPEGKRICEVSNKEIESNADGKGKNLTSPVTMTEIIVQQLQQVLERRCS